MIEDFALISNLHVTGEHFADQVMQQSVPQAGNIYSVSSLRRDTPGHLNLECPAKYFRGEGVCGSKFKVYFHSESLDNSMFVIMMLNILEVLSV